jgi:hypothetical protein
VLVLGIFPRPAPAPAQPAAERAAIQALLDRRARAIEERDKRAFIDTITRGSDAFVRRQRRSFESMRGVPFASYDLHADWSAYGDLARSGDEDVFPDAQDVTIPVTVERYRIKGLDDAPASESLYYSFAKEDGEWRIAEDRTIADAGFMTARHLWDYGPVVVERHGSFSILRHPCRGQEVCARLPEGTPALLDGALARMRRYWSGPWPERVGVVVPDSTAELRRILQASFDLSEFIAFAYSTAHKGRYTAPRIVLNWRTLENRSASSIQRVFAHELMHVATRSSSGPYVPIFVDEGMADYASNEGSDASLAFFDFQRSAGALDGALPEDHEFTTGDGTAIFLSYQSAQSAVGFFVQSWGLDAFERFYKRLGRQRSGPGTAEYHLSAALRKTIGIGLGGFERAWADSLGL